MYIVHNVKKLTSNGRLHFLT